jgi:membrane-associated phospholipid phosphatase
MTDRGQRGEIRIFWIIAAASALTAAAGLAGLDQALADLTRPSSSLDALSGTLVGLLDQVTLKPLSNFLLGALLLLAGGLLLILPMTRRGGWLVFYLGLVQFLATTVADLAKPQLGRMRPWEADEAGVADAWFVGANAFPSGHVAFYAGLFLPFVLLLPRLRLLWLVPPLFVAASRIMVHDHYLSDVAASLALAAMLAATVAPLARRGRAPEPAAA